MLPKDVVTAHRIEFTSGLGGIEGEARSPWYRTRNTMPDTTTWTVLQSTAPVQNKLTENTYREILREIGGEMEEQEWR